MKKILFLSVLVVVCIVTTLSAQFEDNPTKENDKSASLENITLMQANAVEVWCDSKDPEECFIGGSKATGYLWTKY